MSNWKEINEKKLAEARANTLGSKDYKSNKTSNYKINADGSKTLYAFTPSGESLNGEVNSSLAKPQGSNQMIDSMYDRQKEAQLSQLKASREKAIGQLNQQKTELKPQYQGMRNQSDVVANQNAQRLREIMQANGLGSSGENVSANVGLQTERQNALNSLNLQEQQATNDIDRRIADVNNVNDEMAIVQALEAQRSQSLLNQYNNNRQFGLQEAGVTGQYNGTPTMNYQNMQFNQGMANRQFDYQQQRDNVGDQRWQQQFDLSKEGQEFNQKMTEEQFAYQQARDQIGDQRWQKQFDEDTRRFGLTIALERQVKQGQLSQQQASLALSQSRFNYQKEQDAKEWDYRQQQEQSANEQNTTKLEQQQKDTGYYNEFLMDIGRISDHQEGIKLINAYQNMGASPDVITQMTKELNERFLDDIYSY